MQALSGMTRIRRTVAAGTMGVVTEPIRPEDMRVSDADRAVTARHLQWAQGEGLLDLGEFDTRSGALYAATTRGELDRLVRDLPAVPAAVAARRPGVFADTGGGTAMRVLTIVFTSIAVVNLVVWGLVTITNGEAVYPWFLWTGVPPLAVLGTLYAFGIGRPKRD
ncbi:DUF1707 domain-containing protein [Pseudonocardia sp. WMMC193]|uniref:DUF1707 SHOCT-like domain-containing protein n=1 Tax=Pseudonocardia sp. WMMC193 TaxID=2911965 RepID=UPI001F2C4BCA|nr:DUF1707 domain-containing protein [Pseudonocardia sp. WMMC193]MCF7551639.1 DUF1707 domain-containing protein [Pseudonocardia sp. WMMC193]